MPVLQIYNTLHHKKEVFKPINPDNIRIYSCGPTVYGEPHLGNMRKFFVDDVLKKVIKYILKHPVTHVMNITDVGHLTDDGDHGEDKMERWAKKEKTTARDIAKKYEDIFVTNCQKLWFEAFDVMPRATDHIAEQIEMIKILENKWYTYEIPWDGIYMDTSKVADYGVLVGQKHLEWLKDGARVEDTGKKNITDFALWKFNTTGKTREMERESPRWVGFPGRHIECSAMATKYLGTQFDIHTWWIDHIPVHHTNEIAQAQCSIWKTPWVKYRVHAQFLNIDGQKISKSLGNVINLWEVFDRGYTMEDIRYFFMQAHYKTLQDFTREALEAARKWRQKLKLVDSEWYPYEEVVAPLLDDLNTPQFLAKIQKHGITTELNDFLHLYKAEKTKEIEIPTEIKKLAEARWQAKLTKDYTTADQLRDQLSELGWEMKDRKDEYEIMKK